jgi:hypothetical protein
VIDCVLARQIVRAYASKAVRGIARIFDAPIRLPSVPIGGRIIFACLISSRGSSEACGKGCPRDLIWPDFNWNRKPEPGDGLTAKCSGARLTIRRATERPDADQA